MREIGSEFWKQQNVMDVKQVKDGTCDAVNLLSGRTALDFIIRDIKEKQKFHIAMLPAYCCDSMIEPFVKNGIKTEFYNITVEDIEFNADFDVILLIDYFGYENKKNEVIAEKVKSAGKGVIYDATHKINGHPEVERYADYSFCSYRKWFYCNFATVVKHTGKFWIDIPIEYHEGYCALRNRAADLKAKYMSGEDIDKTLFLNQYVEAEAVLSRDYVGYAGEEILVDKKEIVEVRRTNAQYLIDGLSPISEIKLWRNVIGENDAPFFVPIFMKNEMRNKLRKYLIAREIYCPVHWPISQLHIIDENMKSIYSEELSLICDQRYGIKEMEKEIEAIVSFIGEYSK